MGDHPIHYCTNDLNQQLTDFFKRHSYSNIAVLVDENTDRYCYGYIAGSLPSHIKIVIESGEEKKNLRTCEVIWDYLTNHRFDRKSLMINLGGGVIGDMGGFCASTYKRGIDFINLPSTLLAQVDASIGGKLGIDFKGFKNHIGIFQQPKKVFIDPAFLETLEPRELRSGFAEVIKHALIADGDKFNELEAAGFEALNWNDIIPHSISIKEQIVKSDPREKGLRKILNFGHTIGHAVESYFLENTGSKLLHGEAIAIGMICESYLSQKKLKLSETQLCKIKDYILGIFQPGIIDESAIKKIIPLAIQDKKNESGSIKAALLEQIGICSFDVIIEANDIKESLAYYNRVASDN